MERYIGMTSRDPDERKREWEKEGRDVSGFTVLHRRLSYEDAQELERMLKGEFERCKDCEGHPGGRKVAGQVYSVYIY